jgi:magnesium-transporting ATPase (P-type)
VGDLLYIEKDEDIPADLLLLKSSLDTGMCFVDTMNLDGETNLKEKMIPAGMKDIPKKEIIQARGYLICNLPDEYLEKWDCNLNINVVPQSVNCR